MPDVSTPASTACRMPPRRRMGLIARRWCSWPSSIASPCVERDAQAGAEEGLLDVVRRQGVAGEEGLDVAVADQPADVLRRPVWTIAGPPTSRTFFPSARVAADRGRDLPEADRLGLLARDADSMNSNRVDSRGRSSGTTRTPAWPTTIGMPSVTSVIGTHRADLAVGVDDDAAVHLLVLHVDPLAAEPDLGPLVGRAVEAFGEGPGDVGRHDPRVLGVDGRGAVLDQVAEDRVELAGGGRPDGDPGVARVDPPRADPALADLERPPHLEDPVEDLRQQQRIDDVAADLDLFHGRGRLLRRRVLPFLSRHDRSLLHDRADSIPVRALSHYRHGARPGPARSPGGRERGERRPLVPPCDIAIEGRSGNHPPQEDASWQRLGGYQVGLVSTSF